MTPNSVVLSARIGCFATVCFLTLTTISCREATPPARVDVNTNAVAVVGGREITAEMLRAELGRQTRRAGSEPGAEQKRAALEALIQNEALYAKARATGFDRTPEMEARLRNLVIAQFKEAHLPTTNATISDNEVQSYYQANKARYATPLSVRAAVIFLEAPAHATDEKQKQFRLHAESVLDEAKAATGAQEFADVVRRHSTDQASRYRGGDIGWLSRGRSGSDTNIFAAVSILKKPGDFAPLIFTPRGVFIATLQERQEAGFKPLADVTESIRYQLARQKAQQAQIDFYASLKDSLEIQINQSLLESITLPVENNQPPRLPGTTTAQFR